MLHSPRKTLTASHRDSIFTLEEHVKMEPRMISTDVFCHRANLSVAIPHRVQFIQKDCEYGKSPFLLLNWCNRHANGGSGPPHVTVKHRSRLNDQCGRIRRLGDRRKDSFSDHPSIVE
jgi:hypothetical protein